MPLHSSRGHEGRNLRVGQTFVVERRFFTALREALMKQESVSSDTQRRMVVKATPVAPFVGKTRFFKGTSSGWITRKFHF